MTDLEVIETRILIASAIGVPPDEVDYIHANLCSKPHWFFIEHNKAPEFNTLLFFDEKPTLFDITEEIKHMKEVIGEWDEETL